MSLENLVKNDIKSFFASIDEQDLLFFNERDMQVKLAVYLMQSGNNYDEVDLEYFIPYKQLRKRLGEAYLWKSDIYLDIVVRKGDEYVAVELKYPTKKIAKPLPRFGEVLEEEDATLLKEHSAQDIVQYNFWKDVRRLELLKKCFPSVKKGFAIMLTNDMLYTKPRRKGIACEEFSTEGDIRHSRSKHWHNRKAWMEKGYPDFDLDEQYSIEWHPLKLAAHDFSYCMVEV